LIFSCIIKNNGDILNSQVRGLVYKEGENIPMPKGKYFSGVMILPLLSRNLSGRKSSGSFQDSSMSILLKFATSIVSWKRRYAHILYMLLIIIFVSFYLINLQNVKPFTMLPLVSYDRRWKYLLMLYVGRSKCGQRILLWTPAR